MSIKETIKFNGADTFIKLPLKISDEFVDYQQQIDNLNEKAKEELINPVIDYEVRKYKYKKETTETTLTFFFTPNGSSANDSFGSTGAGFTTTEINDNANVIRNSFFILDFYDSFDDYTQNKIFTIYNTKILDSETDPTEDDIPVPIYKISNTNINQFYSWYIPESYLAPYIYSGYTTIQAYVKISFYNAKKGKISLFYNQANAGLSTPKKMYIEARLYPQTMEWQFTSDNVTMFEYPPTNAYVNRVNNRVDNFNNEKQDYPDGNVFDTKDGKYD